MKFVCPDCGYEAAEAGDCPTCEVPLLREEGVSDVVGVGEEAEEFEDEDEEKDDEEW